MSQDRKTTKTQKRRLTRVSWIESSTPIQKSNLRGFTASYANEKEKAIRLDRSEIKTR